MDLSVEAIGFRPPGRDRRVETGERRSTGAPDAQADTDHGTAPGGDADGVRPRGLGSGPRRVHGVCSAVDDIVVEGVFEESRRVSLAEQPSSGGLVVAEEELTRPLELKLVGAQLSVRYNDAALTVGGARRLAGVFEQGPAVAEAHQRQHGYTGR